MHSYHVKGQFFLLFNKTLCELITTRIKHNRSTGIYVFIFLFFQIDKWCSLPKTWCMCLTNKGQHSVTLSGLGTNCEGEAYHGKRNMTCTCVLDAHFKTSSLRWVCESVCEGDIDWECAVWVLFFLQTCLCASVCVSEPACCCLSIPHRQWLLHRL